MDIKCRRDIFLLFISALAMTLISPVRLWTFTWVDDRLVASSMRGTIHPAPERAWADLNGDGLEDEISLQAGAATVRITGSTVWSSPPDWEIKRIHVTDFNRDGEPELSLLIWRDFSPWPIDAWLVYPGRIDEFHDQQSRSCHVILIGWKDAAFREVWAGSALSRPLLDFAASDVNGDGYQELIALESSYDAHTSLASAVTVWEWNGFGFTLLARAPEGRFRIFKMAFTQQGTPLVLLEGTLWR